MMLAYMTNCLLDLKCIGRGKMEDMMSVVHTF